MPTAIGFGIRRKRDSKTLDVLYSNIFFEDKELQNIIIKFTKTDQTGFYTLDSSSWMELIDVLQKDELIDLGQPVNGKHSYYTQDLGIFILNDLKEDLVSVEDAYFRLQCLSQLKVQPHGINLNGVFGIMHNIAWTNQGPILAEDLERERIRYRIRGEQIEVSHVDKFPYMVNYFVPKGVRIVSGAKVRLGAHLSPGTTVMPAGYVNFNAGTLGNAMVEGRISAGVVVGKNTDIGGGASIMGTLSGGNTNVISIGEKCLLGANAGTGISLGFGCTIAAGVYVTAGSKVWLYDSDSQPCDIDGKQVSDGENIVKGAALNNRDKLLFLVDSTNGHLICKPNPKTIALNESLHHND